MSISEALARYSTAKGYKRAVWVIHESPLYNQSPDVKRTAILPTHLLVGFSIELYFKAWLLHAGKPSAEVRAYGHKLQELFVAAKQLSLPEVSRLAEVVDLFAEPHKDFTYRYIGCDDQLMMANWSAVLPVIDELDKVVDGYLGASASVGLQPGH